MSFTRRRMPSLENVWNVYSPVDGASMNPVQRADHGPVALSFRT